MHNYIGKSAIAVHATALFAVQREQIFEEKPERVSIMIREIPEIAMMSPVIINEDVKHSWGKMSQKKRRKYARQNQHCKYAKG